MEGGVGFAHDAVHSPEAVNHKVIGRLSADVFQHRFSKFLQGSVFAFLKGRLTAFGSMEDDSCRRKASLLGTIPAAVCRKNPVPARVCSGFQAGFDAKSIAIDFLARRSLHLPHRGRFTRRVLKMGLRRCCEGNPWGRGAESTVRYLESQQEDRWEDEKHREN